MRAVSIAVVVALALSSAVRADVAASSSRADLMRACMAEWKAKSKAPGGETVKYTAFLSECLKRMAAKSAHKPG